MRNFKLAVLATLSAFTAAAPAVAATATANMNVKITIQNECKIATPADLDFGTRGVLDANFDATTALSVTCTTGQAYNVGISAGGGSGATTTTRKMTGGASTVNYTLWRDAAHTLNWGNAVGTDTQAGTGNGAAQSITVYGRVPPQTTPAAGNYADTVTVTVTY
jgi:spore coat protein U-like protein